MDFQTICRDVERGLFQAEGPSVDVRETTASWLASARPLLATRAGRMAPADCLPGTQTSHSLLAAIVAASVRRRALAASDDTDSLTATAQGATILERRVALARLAELAGDDPSQVDNAALDTVAYEPELERDLLLLRAKLRGSTARDAKSALSEVDALTSRFEARVRQVLEGTSADDPLFELGPHERTRIMLHLRGVDDRTTAFLADQLAQVVQNSEPLEAADRIAMLRPAADVRLLPALTHMLLDDARSEVRAEAARALARIDDRRVMPMLLGAYTRASDLNERLALAEALGIWGDYRGSDAVREALTDGRETIRVVALEAVHDPELAEAVVPLAHTGGLEQRRAAVRALARSGNERAIAWLDKLESDDSDLPPALLRELGVAQNVLLARAEMRGERPDILLMQARTAKKRKQPRRLGAQPTKRHRVMAWLLMLRALFAAWFGMRETASDSCERALEADPGWYYPPLMQARLWERAGDRARAVAGYRQALAIAPGRLTANPTIMKRLATLFLQRIEELVSAGRVEIARAVADELSLQDLSQVPSHLRLALRRRRRRLSLSPALEAGSESDSGERS